MNRQVRFLFGDMKHTLFHFCINFMQLTAGLILCCYVLTIWHDFRIVKNQIRQATEYTEIYMLRDDTSYKKFDTIINEKVCLKKLGELYEYIQEEINNARNSSGFYLADSSMKFYYSADASIPKHVAEYDSITGTYHSLKLSVTANFFEIFHLDLDEVEKEDVEAFDFPYKEKQEIPVILGADFRTVYKKNAIIQDRDGLPYRVIGFLKKNSNYVAPDESRKLLSLDKVIITPQIIDKTDSLNIVRYIQNLYIMSDKREIADNIVDFSRSKGLFDLSVINFSYQLDCIISDTEDEIFINSVFMFIILLFTCVGIIGNLLQFITNNKKEFAINLLCGANRTDIIFRILLQILVMMVLGILTVFFLFGFTKSFCLTVLFAAVLTIAVMGYPVYWVKRQTITTMIRRSYE
ncbi:ABC transporter permease family protein [[Clostridium] polysaccharolyticum]|uniref:MacB-like core domain-containing protein n=1 Tax=[Clostridium] polysaccharolyticum TaxID=29364 RepID=A0A1H9Z720_9FIRM|nr:ABC transporter permease [[Clostridium] polysaccharolyticum]SES77329.1 hypothetical protein SAMN04487772_10332 [[Clostridium] polysaccharolyticum]